MSPIAEADPTSDALVPSSAFTGELRRADTSKRATRDAETFRQATAAQDHARAHSHDPEARLSAGLVGDGAPGETSEMKLGRNDPCHCGSGDKYKKCHLEKDQAEQTAKLAAEAAQRREAAAAEAEAEEKDGSEGTPAGARPKDASASVRPNPKGQGGAAPALFRRRSV